MPNGFAKLLFEEFKAKKTEIKERKEKYNQWECFNRTVLNSDRRHFNETLTQFVRQDREKSAEITLILGQFICILSC